MEGGLMSFLVKGAQGELLLTTISFYALILRVDQFNLSVLCVSGRVIEDAEEKQAVLLKNYLEHVHNKFNKYAFCFFFCELLNICISISQVGSN